MPASGAEHLPAWFTPGRLLCIFCVMNMFVYLDRGVIASNGVNGSQRTTADPRGTGVQGQFGLSNVQDGLLPAAFMVGLLLASPVFAEAAKHSSAFRLIGIGMGVWTLATAGCGLAPSFGALLACRMAVGVGEASFVSLAAPFIDDHAPPAAKSRWFAMFYLCIPVGVAAGYIYGGVVAGTLGWRAAFLTESLMMLPFVIFMFLAPPLHLHGSDPLEEDDEDGGGAAAAAVASPRSKARRHRRTLGQAATEFWQDVVKVASQRVWATMVLSYTAYTSVLGCYAYWGPKAGAQLFSLPSESADIWFGAVTVVTGVVGVVGGGLLMDHIGANLRNAALLCAVSSFTGWALALLSFLAAPTFPAFMVMFALAELGLFLSQAPVVGLGMWSVPTALRPLAISLTTLSIHVFGDVPSPPFLGWLQDQLASTLAPADKPQMWRISMSIVSSLLLLSGAGFLAAAAVARTATDYRFVDPAPSAIPAEAAVGSDAPESDQTPLLRDAAVINGDGGGAGQV